jgi:3-hydroxyisobutyrate dehydrogenase-like beta-hydroxyacid dehydrogenase
MAAQNGKLAYYLGGSEAMIARARPILEASAAHLLPMGPVGAATVVKIATNLVSAATVKALVEAAAITQSQGVGLGALLEAFKVNANFSPLIAMKLPAMQQGQFEPHFSLKNMLKDADYACALAREAGLVTPVLDATAAQMRDQVEQGQGELDFCVMGEALTETAA